VSRFTDELMKKLEGCKIHWLGQPVFSRVSFGDVPQDSAIIISVCTDRCANDHHHHDANLVRFVCGKMKSKLEYLKGQEISVEEVHTAIRLPVL